jgi:cell pole-organizing protein PopZ
MSSFDKTAGKNLDEILASIRKTLADESTPPQPTPPPPKAATDPSTPASASQNGSKSAVAKIDDDLADLLAGGLDPAGPQTGLKETPQTSGESKDPLWFLRPNGGREQVSPPRADEAVDGLAGSGISPERSSLAPLFVADRASAPEEVHAAANALASSSAQAKTATLLDPPARDSKVPDPTLGRELTPTGNGAAEPSPAPEVAAPDTAAVAKTPSDPPATARAEQTKPGPLSGPAMASLAVAPAAAPLKPAPLQDHQTGMVTRSSRLAEPERSRPVAPMPGPGLVEAGGAASPIVHSASTGLRANALNGATSGAALPDVASASAVPAAQTQALEQIIEQLLEPLLRRWVEANLPRLVDAAIRVEVARALEVQRGNGQDIDRKM